MFKILYIMFYFILDHSGSTVLIMKLFLNYFKYNNVQIKWKAKNNITLVTLSEQLKKPELYKACSFESGSENSFERMWCIPNQMFETTGSFKYN
jgi:biotin synthase-related radical SAM superfamily protein